MSGLNQTQQNEAGIPHAVVQEMIGHESKQIPTLADQQTNSALREKRQRDWLRTVRFVRSSPMRGDGV